MTPGEKKQVQLLRQQGLGYKRIAVATQISENTIKSFCRSHPLETDGASCCLTCGKAVLQTPHKRKRKFCSDKCRYKWWSLHPQARAKPHTHICRGCGTEFRTDRAASAYCSIPCYAAARRKEASV